MKKLILLLAAIMVFAFAGCAEDKPKEIENITREKKEQSSTGTSNGKKENDIGKKKSSKTEEKSSENEKDSQEDNSPNEEESEQESEQPTKTLAQIQTEIKSAVSATGAMDLDADAISSLYGIETNDMVQAVGFVVMEGTFPHEAVMVEAKNVDAATRVETLLKAKHTSFVEQSKGYDATNYALAQKCKVVRNGNYISMFLTPDYEDMRAVYKKYIK